VCRTMTLMVLALVVVGSSIWYWRSSQTSHQPLGPNQRLNVRDGSILVLVPEGSFQMGEEAVRARPDEKPVQRLALPAYWIGLHEVTNAQFQRFVAETGYPAGPRWEDHARMWGGQAPVLGVSWKDAQAYCRWAGLRLPTEAEWEKAARGTDGRQYPWGDSWDPDRAWWQDTSEVRAHDVGSLPQGASPFGCLDMAGNVAEWCSSRYRPYPYRASDGREDPKASGARVVRGGQYFDEPWELRCSARGRAAPAERRTTTGFRVALSVQRSQASP